MAIPHDDPPAFVAAAREAEGVLVGAVGPSVVRMVTHLDVSRDDAERAAKVFAEPLTPRGWIGSNPGAAGRRT